MQMKFKRGMTFSYAGCIWKPDPCAPFTMEGCTIEADLRRKIKFEFVQHLQAQVLDPVKNLIGLFAHHTETALWKPQSHYIDIRVIDENGAVVQTVTRHFDVVDNVTR